MISSKFAEPNSFFNQFTKEYWHALPPLSKDEARLQAGLLLKPPPKSAAYCRFFVEGGRRVPTGLGGPELEPKDHDVQPDLGLSRLYRSPTPGSLIYRDLHCLGVEERWIKVL